MKKATHFVEVLQDGLFCKSFSQGIFCVIGERQQGTRFSVLTRCTDRKVFDSLLDERQQDLLGNTQAQKLSESPTTTGESLPKLEMFSRFRHHQAVEVSEPSHIRVRKRLASAGSMWAGLSLRSLFS